MRLLEAIEITGGLSTPSKMPCHSINTSTSACNVGTVMRKIKGSTCEKCYALRNNYKYPAVKAAMKRRLDGIKNKKWVEAMSFLINAYEGGAYFRWHDSGDIQSVRHMKKIVEVCNATPTVRHWLPTREYISVNGKKAIIQTFINAGGKIPDNLTVRLSALMIDSQPPTSIANQLGVQTSTVSTHDGDCPAKTTANKCDTCRKCWDKTVANVAYPKK